MAITLAYSIYVYSFSAGITGRTKKNGIGCTCHGLNPTAGVTVTISGPDTLQPDQTAAYSVTISGGPAVAAGTNIAASGGTLNVTAGTLQKIGDELTHVAPLLFEASSVSFDFSYTAPAVEGAETLYANGNSVNNTGSTSGDQWNFAPNKPVIVKTQVIPPPPFVLSDTVNAGWNIVSLPLTVQNSFKDSVFAFSTSSAFAYEGGTYAVKDSLTVGTGYWLRFDSMRIIDMEGEAVFRDTMHVVEGWNLIGSISEPVPIESLRTIPSDIIVSSFFSFEGYYKPLQQTESLKPARGYWIKVNQDGEMIVAHDTVLAKRAFVSTVSIDRFNRLTITDRAGHQQSLFFGGTDAANVPIERYELPPKPPQGSFDVRFASQRFAEVFNQTGSQEFPIQVSFAEYPISIEWNVRTAATPALLNVGAERVALTDQGSIVVSEPRTAVSLIARPSEIPGTVALFQNYPNPFNPSTEIRYSVAEPSDVTIGVFDLLGKEVQALVQRELPVGEFAARWEGKDENGRTMPSGVYVIRLSVIPHDGAHQPTSASKKIVLMK